MLIGMTRALPSVFVFVSVFSSAAAAIAACDLADRDTVSQMIDRPAARESIASKTVYVPDALFA